VSSGPSLYRRHRPRTFAEVVGQEHVVRTLTNAVERDRVHHAYLFVGSRGTGKTSMAKILAACLNCERGPTVQPCGVCDSCLSIASASSLDVIEMDAASSNSVDDIRALRDSVAYAPVSGRQKIYILDEAHMLSTAAWNAFLKTLEEPPPNTVFVLATTEAQKVLPTVVDRCHRFDFQRPTAEQIATVVVRSARTESIAIGPEAVAVLARHASGSFRDALGILEQLQTYAGDEIALADVLAVLGISDADLLFRAFDAVAAGDARAALAAAAAAVDGGHDPAAYIRELETHARELLIVQMQGGEVPAELSLTPERDERLADQAERLDAATLVRTLDLLAAALTHLRAGADARTQLELALVKSARADLDPSVAALAARLERLERGPSPPSGAVVERPPAAPAAVPPVNGGSASAAPARPAPAPTPVAPAPVPDAVTSAPAPGPAPVPDAGTSTPAAVLKAPVPDATTSAASPAPGPAAVAAPIPGDVGAPVPGEAPVPGAETRVAAPVPGAAAAQTAAAAPTPGAAPAAGTPVPGAATAAVAPPARLLTLEAIVGVWPDVLDTIRASNAMLGAVVDDAHPVELDGDRLVLAFGEDAGFLRKKAEERATRTALGDAVRAVTGHALTFSYELREGHGPPAPSLLSEDELVARLKEQFDAEELGDTDEEDR
jgi:DNA polymerase III subunit gamma/tau